MQPGLSTHVFLQHRLTTGLLDAMIRSGATAIEIFAARHHFDYADRSAVRDIANWFRDTGIRASLHQPLYADLQWSRHVAPNLNLIDPEKARRISGMDETKRALDAAEQIPFRSIVLHLGMRGDLWSPRSLENSLTAIEHLKTFAGPLRVQILLENLPNEVTAPEHLLEILEVGHFKNVGICLDVGHAHLAPPAHPRASLDAFFELLGTRIAEVHLHDNDRKGDQHLWPGSTPVDGAAPASSGIDWHSIHRRLSALPPDTPGLLEIAHELMETPEEVTRKASAFFSDEARRSEQELKL